jgi:hypothetical protein
MQCTACIGQSIRLVAALLTAALAHAVVLLLFAVLCAAAAHQ